jgi:hypothetical protein
MGLVCAQLGLSTPEEVQKYLILGHRFESRTLWLDEAIQDLRVLKMAQS